MNTTCCTRIKVYVLCKDGRTTCHLENLKSTKKKKKQTKLKYLTELTTDPPSASTTRLTINYRESDPSMYPPPCQINSSFTNQNLYDINFPEPCEFTSRDLLVIHMLSLIPFLPVSRPSKAVHPLTPVPLPAVLRTSTSQDAPHSLFRVTSSVPFGKTSSPSVDTLASFKFSIFIMSGIRC